MMKYEQPDMELIYYNENVITSSTGYLEDVTDESEEDGGNLNDIW